MSNLDAGLPGTLSPEQVAARLAIHGTPGGIRAKADPIPTPPPAPVEQPEPDEATAVLEAAATAAVELRNNLAASQAAVEQRRAAVVARIEAGRAESDDPATTREARAELAAVDDELAEIATLLERATARADAASRRLAAGRHRDRAAQIEREEADLVARCAASDAAITAAWNGLLDALDARAALEDEGHRIIRDRAGLPFRYWNGPRTQSGGRPEPFGAETFLPAGVRFDVTVVRPPDHNRPRKLHVPL